MTANQDPALTPERIQALNTVDLRLFGVQHGITENVHGMPHVRDGDDGDFDGLLSAANELNAERGDVFVVEPTGFASPWAEDFTLANIVPATIPNIPVAEMPAELREQIVELLERGREDLHLNNLVYAAAHTLLRGVSVHRAEVALEEWETLLGIVSELAPTPEAQDDIKLFYRHTKMLTRLGNYAIGMVGAAKSIATDRPILLQGTGRAHPPILGERLRASGVAFTSNH